MALRDHAPGSPARHAWLDRERLLAGPGPDARATLFLDVIRRVRPRGGTGKELAAELHITPRHLARLTRRWFGYTPHLLLGVVRIAGLARDLATSLDSLSSLTRRHGYPTRQAMNRHFQSFTGMMPRHYRALVRARERHAIVTQMSEFVPSTENANRRISPATRVLAGRRCEGRDDGTVATLDPPRSRRARKQDDPSSLRT